MNAIKIILLSLLIPSELGIVISDLALYPYRIVLIALVPYIAWILLTQKSQTRWSICDTFAIMICIWPIIALWLNTDLYRAIESGGVLALDILIPYAVVRLHVNSYRSRKYFSKFDVCFRCCSCFNQFSRINFWKTLYS